MQLCILLKLPSRTLGKYVSSAWRPSKPTVININFCNSVGLINIEFSNYCATVFDQSSGISMTTTTAGTNFNIIPAVLCLGKQYKKCSHPRLLNRMNFSINVCNGDCINQHSSMCIEQANRGMEATL